MKRRMLVPVVVLVAIVAVSAAQTAQQSVPAAAAKGPRARVEPESFDFGNVLPGKTLEKEFSIRNFGSGELLIENVATTCGCTVAEGYAKSIKPGAATPLRVTLKPNVPSGRVERSVLIKTNDPVASRLEVKVSATVVPGS